jgi:MMP 1-O-methyltransferase
VNVMSLIGRVKESRVRSRIRPYQDIEGWLTEREAMALYHLASLLPSGSTVVEIGSWKGKSTYCLAQGLRDGMIMAIDPFDASGEEGSGETYHAQRGSEPLVDQFRSKMAELKVLQKINIRQGLSRQFVGECRDIDLLFIDGDHSKAACLFDFENYSPYLRHGGYLAFHDFDPTRKDLGPTWVIENRVLPGREYKFIDLFDSLWVCQKI